MVRAGMLNNTDGKLTIKRRTWSHDAGGKRVGGLSTLGTRSFGITWQKAGELDEGDRPADSRQTCTITLRYDSLTKTIDSRTDYFEVGSTTYEIAGNPIDVDSRHMELRFTCVVRS